MVRAADVPIATIDPQTMLPDLLGRHPQARAMFDRYGLHGYGGRLGPVESIRFFAQAHGVDEPRLLCELREAIRRGDGGAVATEPPSIADTIYRRFFIAGTAIILTAGATWGAMLLWRIGLAGSFTGVSVHEVNAYGHAQIAGWAGLFIMGFAYQAFPRIWHTTLAASLLMLLLLPVHQHLTGIEFSHAYYGAIRHAATVGFISMMIMGFAAKVVPTLNRIDPRGLSPLWGPFVLINFGCFLRGTTQALTDAHPAFFGVVGVSGTLEVAALAWWGVGLVAIMRRGKRQTTDEVSSPPAIIQPHHRVAEVLAWFPATAEVFDRLGFSPLRNPVMRRTVARVTSLAQAAAMRGVPLDMMLDTLNNAAGLTRTGRTSPDRSGHTPIALTIGGSA